MNVEINSLPDKITARIIIEALGDGLTPPIGLKFITVGRQRWLDAIKKYYLFDFIKQGGSAVKFVNGDYGAGKTHFLTLVREEAFKENFVVSFVILKTREAPFSKFEIIYQKIISNISVKDKSEGDALKWVLDSWYTKMYEEIADKFGGEKIINEPRIKAELDYSLSELNVLEGMNNDFRNAVKAYFKNMLEAKSDRDEKNNIILGWLKGQKIEKKMLKEFMIYTHIDKGNSKDMMKSLVRLLTFFGYSGLVILLDEAESIPTLLRAQDRMFAYDNIRELMDNTDGRGRGGTNNCLFLYATTSEFFTSRDGIKSYDALYSRVRHELTLKDPKIINWRGPIIDLERDPLTTDDMLELSKKIRNIHETAFDWSAESIVTDDILKKYVDYVNEELIVAEISKPRVLVKTITTILDISEQDKGFDPIKDVEGIVKEAYSDLKRKRDEDEFEF